MRNTKNIFILFLIISGTFLHAQSNQVLRSQAIEAMQNKDWHGAVQYYQRLYAHDSSNIKIQYVYAEAVFMDSDIDLAIYLLSKVAAVDNGRKYPMVFYWMGQSLKHKQNYREAKKWFVKFNRLKLKKEKYKYYKTKSKNETEACDLAQIMVNNPVSIKIEHLDPMVNSVFSEYAPVESDSILYFSSIREEEKRPQDSKAETSKIYKVTPKSKKKITALDTNINSANYHNSHPLFSADKNQMFFSRCISKNATEYTCDLYQSSFSKKRWLPAVKLDSVNKPGYSTTQPAFGKLEGKEVLFFSSNRPGGEGGMDLWYSIANKDGIYEKVINAGKKINSPDDEITPWFDTLNNQLYFSSTWHQGLGGFDIFKSAWKNNEFTGPLNAGYPINSSYNDVYYSGGNSENIYLSSNRPGSEFEDKLNCCNDIYRFKVDKEKPVIVLDSSKLHKERMKLLVPLTLYFHNDQPDPATRNITTTVNYENAYTGYKTLLDQYREEYSNGIKNKKLAIDQIENFFRDSVDAGMEELDKFASLLEKTLQNGETVKITLKGYCSPLATTDYNINLAKRRISSLRNYFRETRNGLFVKYMDNPNEKQGRIIFEEVEVGELPASRVSDDLKDKRNSIYSPQAASERKIQIIAVSFGSE